MVGLQYYFGMSKKRILINFITSDGRVINPLLWKLAHYPKKKFDLTFFCDRRVEMAIEKSRAKVKTVHFLNLPGTKMTSSKLSFLIEAIRRNLRAMFFVGKVSRNFDIVYSVSSVLDLVIFPYVVKLWRKKMVWVSVFDNVVPFTDPGNKLIRFLAWIFFRISLVLIRRADLVFVSTPELMEFLIEKGFDKNKLVQSNLACDERSIRMAKFNRKLRYEALYLGRINETKGIDDMLEVVKKVRKLFPEFVLAMAGSGDRMTVSRYKKRIREEGLGSNVKMLGWVSEKTKYELLKSCRTFWFLSKSLCESFGIALMEAVCSGRPAFVYDLPQMKNIYKRGEVYLFDVGDVESVTKKVLEVFKRSDFDNKKGKQLLGKYSWKTVAETEVKALEKLVN